MLVGQKIGPFHIEKELGSGAMGTVYLARFDNKGKILPVALKVVSLGLLGNESAMARFEREATILKQLKHPNIVRLLATGRYRQTPFIAMEFVDGEALDRILARRTKLSWEETLVYAKDLCDALQHAHDKGIIHRDLKPSNLMITKEGTLKLTDFGIAKDTDVTALTGANSTIGTAAYMSPEQCRGVRDLTAKSDLYSLGVVMYELITGRKPFYAENSMEMFLKHVHDAPVRPTRHIPDLPVWVDNLIMFLLEKQPDIRPMDANTVKKMIEEIEQKVQAQQSLGVEAANARKIDRPLSNQPLDDADREAARALKGERKKKKKKKKVPLQEQTWFRAAIIGTILVALLGVGVWLAWPERLDAAYQKVEAAAPEQQLELATQFLDRHGSTQDPKVDKVRSLFENLKARQEEAVLARRHRNKMVRPEEGYDKVAYENIMAALDAEAAGKLPRAKECWGIVREKIPPLDPAQYLEDEAVRKGAWRWVAEKRLADIAAAITLGQQLKAKLEADLIAESPKTYDPTDPEGLAYQAFRFARLGDASKARSTWETLALSVEKDLEKLRWYLLATEQQNSIAQQSNEESFEARVILLKQKLQDATTRWEEVRQNPEARVGRREVRIVCREIVQLYEGETRPEIQELVTQARKLLREGQAG